MKSTNRAAPDIRSAGVSMIQLMVVLLIMSILTMVALVKYIDYISRSRRTEGILGLNSLDKLQRTYYNEHRRYAINIRELDFAVEGGKYLSDTVYQGKYYRYTTGWRDGKGKSYVGVATGNIDSDGFDDMLVIYR
jgi:Tfp pilus assembly protein PilE